MKKPFSSFKEHIAHYLQLRFTEFKLKTVEKASKAMSYIVFLLIAVFLFFFTFLFLTIGLALWLSEIFNSIYAGVFSTAGLLLLLLIILVLSLKSVIRKFTGIVAAAILKKLAKKSSTKSQ